MEGPESNNISKEQYEFLLARRNLFILKQDPNTSKGDLTLAEMDFEAKEKVLRETVLPTYQPIGTSANPNIPKKEIEEDNIQLNENKVDEIETTTKVTDFNNYVVNAYISPAQKVALEVSRLISMGSFVEQELMEQGMPIVSNSKKDGYDYDSYLDLVINGDKQIQDIPKPRNSDELRRAKVAISNLTDKTSLKYKDDKWTETFFAIQGHLLT